MSAESGGVEEGVLCPFCAEPIKRHAIVCRHCHRDLTIPMPLLLAQREQQRAIEGLRQDLLDLRSELMTLRVSQSDARGLPRKSQAQTSSGDRGPAETYALSMAWGVALVLLVASHWLLIIRFDISVAAFRAVCIGIPLTTAAVMPGLIRARLGLLLGSAVALGISAVFIMSYAVSLHDGTPVVPATTRDLYDMLEFATSIALGFLSGGLASRTVYRLREDRIHRAALEAMGGAFRKADVQNVGKQAAELQRAAEAVAPIAALLGSLFSGFRSLL